MAEVERPIYWIGSSYHDLCDFPRAALRQAGYNLGLVQNDLLPEDYRPVGEVGPGTYEIRLRTQEGGAVQHRIFYVAKFLGAVYVLHAFRKTTRETSQHDKNTGRARYRAMMQDVKQQRRQ